jgi:hypothetical protein
MKNNVLIPVKKEVKAMILATRETIASVPDDQWRVGEANRRIPARQACHFVPAIEDMAGTRGRIGAKHGIKSFGFRKTVAPDAYPSRAQFIAFLDEIEPLVYAQLEEVIDRTCVEKDWAHPPLNTFLYLLRHSIIHLSYMRNELIERGLHVPKYFKHVVRIMGS